MPTLKDTDKLIELIDDDIAALNKDMPREGHDVCLCTLNMVKQYIKALPTVEVEPFKAFACWVASEVCNEGFEEMWTLGAFAEVACRRLYALGIVQKFRDEWVYVDKDELDGGENGTD